MEENRSSKFPPSPSPPAGRAGLRQAGKIQSSKSNVDEEATSAESDVTESHVKVEAKPDESVESLLRRFNREVEKAGILERLRELEFYEKPSVKKKKAKAERQRRIKEYERWSE